LLSEPGLAIMVNVIPFRRTPSMSLDRRRGIVLGLALGDAIGAPFEGGLLERALWKLFGRTSDGRMRYTDDTQMSLDLLASLSTRRGLDQDDLAQRFADSYRWSRGYGAGTARVLKKIRGGADWRDANRSVQAEGSFGNGAAMRAAVLAAISPDFDLSLDRLVDHASEVTHAHPDALRGARLVARVTAGVLTDRSDAEIWAEAAKSTADGAWRTRLAVARTWLESGSEQSPAMVARQLGSSMAAIDSCVSAIYLGLRFRKAEFLDLMRFIAAMGGDADTIGAMAGAIWGAGNGAGRLPAEALARLEKREEILKLVDDCLKVTGNVASITDAA
jgi:ADP-ribosylglycohydrolase